MVFCDETIDLAWKSARGRCECSRIGHSHGYVCNRELVWASRGKDGEPGAWDVYAISETGDDSPVNCAIFCMECLKKI